MKEANKLNSKICLIKVEVGAFVSFKELSPWVLLLWSLSLLLIRLRSFMFYLLNFNERGNQFLNPHFKHIHASFINNWTRDSYFGTLITVSYLYFDYYSWLNQLLKFFKPMSYDKGELEWSLCWKSEACKCTLLLDCLKILSPLNIWLKNRERN